MPSMACSGTDGTPKILVLMSVDTGFMREARGSDAALQHCHRRHRRAPRIRLSARVITRAHRHAVLLADFT